MNFTVLISVYSIHPYRLLEGGIAWNIIRALDQKFRLIVVTHPGNRQDIEYYLAHSPEGSCIQAQFEYYTPPLQRQDQSPRKTFLHKYLWHWGVISFIQRRQLQFDLAHHLSYPCGWCPSFLWRLGKPFVWGPVGYPPPVPGTFIRRNYGWTAYLKDRLCWGLKKSIWSLDPFTDVSARKAAHIFAGHATAAKALSTAGNQTTVLPALPMHTAWKIPRPTETFKIVCAGPFTPLSGFDLAIRAFATFYRRLATSEIASPVEMVMIGRGSARRRLEQMAAATGLPSAALRIIESDDPALIEEHFSEAKVFLSPTHDYMDQLLPQALAHGLPVVCFDHAEMGSLVSECCGLKVIYSAYEETVRQFADHLLSLFQDPERRQSLSAGARKKFERQLTWAYQGDAISEVYWNVFHRNELWKLTKKDIA